MRLEFVQRGCPRLAFVLVIAAITVRGSAPSASGGGAPPFRGVVPLRVSALTAGITPVPQRISVAPDGTQSDGDSYAAILSDNGRFVVFESKASNLVGRQPVGAAFFQVYVYDRETGALTRESVGRNGVPGNGDSTAAAISDSGHYVSFTSRASNLSAEPGPSDSPYYIRDRETGHLGVAPHPLDGTTWFEQHSGTVLSGDGRYLSYVSSSLSPVTFQRLFTLDLTNGITTSESLADGFVRLIGIGTHEFSMSRDGRYMAFVVFQSGSRDILAVRDRLTGELTTESMSPTEVPVTLPSNPSLSANGRFLAFVAFNFDGVLVRDREARRTVLIPTQTRATSPKLSSDGRFVSYRTILGRCFVYDTIGAVHIDMGPANDCSAVVGGAIAYSTSQPLSPDDTNGVSDIYIATLD
jgi:Tol biopolymer transport system component